MPFNVKKRKAIEKAYIDAGIDWVYYKFFIDNNGYVRESVWHEVISEEDKKFIQKYQTVKIEDIPEEEEKLYKWMYYPLKHKLRIKSLEGIENNNGWIRIESESDLPKEYASYFVRYHDGSVIMHHFSPNSDFDKILFMEEFTHYQPVKNPKPPIF